MVDPHVPEDRLQSVGLSETQDPYPRFEASSRPQFSVLGISLMVQSLAQEGQQVREAGTPADGAQPWESLSDSLLFQKRRISQKPGDTSKILVDCL